MALSYDHGTSAAKLLGETIGGALDRTVARYGERAALIVRHQGVRWTWRELAERVEAIAAGLVGLGLGPGDRVGIWAPNCAEWTQLQLATAKAGIILVNINPAYRRAELAYVLQKVGCAALVLAPALKTSDYLAILNELVPELAGATPGELRAEALPELRIVVRLGAAKTPGMLNFDELAARGGEVERARLAELTETLQFDDAINIQFTSGTTGHPKARRSRTATSSTTGSSSARRSG
jgi:fatty-acyl-CoA synthase